MIEQADAVRIKRSRIRLAGYNPRKISPESKKKLEKNMKEFGLMGGIVWNETTGNLVSGHQRISILDKEHKGEDYDILVTAVRLTEEQEKAQNIFFNNALAQGVFDDAKLDKLMKEINFTENSGFLKREQLSYLKDTSLTDAEYSEICESVAEMSQQLEDMKRNVNKDINANYVVLVFPNRGDKEELIDNLGIHLDDGRFANGHEFLEELYDKWQDSQG